jgi:hypothetical protein
MGNDIDIKIEAEGDELIAGVTCSLDGSEIASDDVSGTPVVSFHRTFGHVGEGRPGQTHKLIVEARGRDAGSSKFATRIWTDLT